LTPHWTAIDAVSNRNYRLATKCKHVGLSTRDKRTKATSALIMTGNSQSIINIDPSPRSRPIYLSFLLTQHGEAQWFELIAASFVKLAIRFNPMQPKRV